MTKQNLFKQCEKYIDDHLNENITTKDLANHCNYSLYYFCHLFKVHCNLSVGEYILQKKMQTACKLLQKNAIRC